MTFDHGVDVIIPVSKPDVLFYNCIKRILKQTVAVGRIIIIPTDDADIDIDMISDKMEVHCFLGRRKAVSDIKNFGASFSDADIIVFISPEAKAYNKYTIERLIRPLIKGEGIAASYARSLARGDCNESERYDLIYYYPRTSFVLSPDNEEPGRRLSPLGYDCSAYIKEAFNKADGYDESYYSEDTLLALELMDMGERVAYCGEAVVVASKDISPLGEFKRYFDIGVFQKQALAKYGFGLEKSNEARLGIKKAMYLMDYNEYIWMGFDLFYKIAKYLGYLFGNSYNILPKQFRSFMSSHPEQFD